MALLTADWTPFGKDEFFRRFDIYDMEWCGELNLETSSLASTRFGGPIAAIRDKKKFVTIQGGGLPTITVFSTAGKIISSFIWRSGKIVEVGWSTHSDLLFVQDDAKILVYDMFGEMQYYFSISKEAEDTKVVEAQMFMTLQGTGVAVVTTTERFYIVNTIRDKESRTCKLLEPKEIGGRTAWLACCPDRRSQVWLARGSHLYRLEEASSPIKLNVVVGDDDSEIVSIALSVDYEFLALYTNQGKLWLGTAELARPFRLFDARSTILPTQMMWCGGDAVVVNLGGTVEVVGPRDEHIQYMYDSAVYLIQEVDCVRLLTSTSQEILQRVPDPVREIFRINSNAPGSYLLEASRQYQRKSHQANEYLHLVKTKLFAAVMQCIDAAGHEFKLETQEMLLKAAQFGKTFLDDFSPDAYVDMVRLLPCLNAVRDSKIGIPLTFFQFQLLKMSGLLDLLVWRRQYYLALKIAKFLKLPDNVRILSQWACYKVKQNLSKDQIAKEIAEKLENTKGISYTEIAKKAAEANKTELAIKLIEYEPCASLQVPLLLKLGDAWAALQKAIDSGNTDLVYFVLQHFKEKVYSVDSNFQMQIRNYPLAQALYLKFLRQFNHETLVDVLRQEDDKVSLAECYIRESFDPKKAHSRESLVTSSSECYKNAKMDCYHTLCEEQLKLTKYQRQLEEKFRLDLTGKSLHETVKSLLDLKEVKYADKLRSEYRMPDRRYWWLRIQVLAEQDDWTGLEAFSKLKKSPIGYEPFVDVCLGKNKQFEAMKYYPKIKEDMKITYLLKMGNYKEASQMAFQQEDVEALKYIQLKCDQGLAENIVVMIQHLSRK